MVNCSAMPLLHGKSLKRAYGHIVSALLLAACFVLAALWTPTSHAAGNTKPVITEIKSPDGGKLEKVGIGDGMAISVRGLDATQQPQDLVLFLNGIPLPDHTPESVRKSVDPECKPAAKGAEPPDCAELDVLQYKLKRDVSVQQSAEAWLDLLKKPKDSTRTVRVSLGMGTIEKISGESAADTTVQLEIFRKGYSAIVVGIFIAALLIFIFFVTDSKIIRDAPAKNQTTLPPFSLGRTQMAWWFFLVLAAYLYIGLVTTDFETISEQALILMGIAAATGFGSIAIVSDKSSKASGEMKTAETELARLKAEQEKSQAELDSLTALTTRTTQQDARVVLLSGKLGEYEKQTELLDATIKAAEKQLQGPQSQGFLKDLVSDKSGVSFHRFQILVWSLVLGFVFISQTLENLAMPEFSATLLTLMGITSGTYIGFKFPEQKT